MQFVLYHLNVTLEYPLNEFKVFLHSRNTSLILVDVFTSHILQENAYFTNHTEKTKHKIMVFRLAHKYQIIRQCHNFKAS